MLRGRARAVPLTLLAPAGPRAAGSPCDARSSPVRLPCRRGRSGRRPADGGVVPGRGPARTGNAAVVQAVRRLHAARRRCTPTYPQPWLARRCTTTTNRAGQPLHRHNSIAPPCIRSPCFPECWCCLDLSHGRVCLPLPPRGRSGGHPPFLLVRRVAAGAGDRPPALLDKWRPRQVLILPACWQHGRVGGCFGMPVMGKVRGGREILRWPSHDRGVLLAEWAPSVRVLRCVSSSVAYGFWTEHGPFRLAENGTVGL